MRGVLHGAAGVLGLLVFSSALRAQTSTSTRTSTSTNGSDSAAVVVDAGRVEGRISPLLYGQFMEFMFGGVKGGLTAELLRDRGFEDAPNAIGLPRYWERYPDDRDDDYGLAFRWDDSVAYPVSTEALDSVPVPHALRVEAGQGVVQPHGIYQPGIPVRAGATYAGYLWLRSAGYAGPIGVALEEDRPGGSRYAEARIDVHADTGWVRYPFTLTSAATDARARFVVSFPGRGRLWLDQLSLLPADAKGGVRADVEALVAALKPAFIRWPGGNVAQDYHWRWGVGPRDRRPTWVNLSWKNELEPGDFGTDEFVAFARRVGAEPSLTVNVEGRGATPEEAAGWVEYCNGPPSSRYGALRAANGHPEPFGVKYWEIGNEIWGDWVRGHSDAATYARNLVRYVRAMRAVDPTIRVIAVGDNDTTWDRTVLRAAGRAIDYLAIHHYYGTQEAAGDARNLRARPLHYERFYRDLERMIRQEAPGHPITLAINEWGLDLPENRQWSMEAASYGARLLNVFLRSAPLVAMSAVSDLVNGWPGGIVQAGRDAVFVSPMYHVNRMYASHAGRERLRTTVEGPTFDTSKEGTGVPVLDAVATRAGDGRIFLHAVNTDASAPLSVRIEVRGARVAPAAELELLSAPPGAWNSFATPDAVVPRTSTIPAGATFTLTLPPQSVAVLTLRPE